MHSAFEEGKKGIWMSKYEPVRTDNVTGVGFPHYLPDLTGFNEDTTYIEVYNEETESFEETKLSEIDNIREFAKYHNWFNYDKQIWANIKVVDEESQAESWWVWIPRYAYNITETTTSIKFIDINNNPLDGTELGSNYIVHPAFGNNQKGIWMSKYEPVEEK